MVVKGELIYSFQYGILQQQLRDKELVRLSFLTKEKLEIELEKKSHRELVDLAEDLMLDFEEYDNIKRMIFLEYTREVNEDYSINTLIQQLKIAWIS